MAKRKQYIVELNKSGVWKPTWFTTPSGVSSRGNRPPRRVSRKKAEAALAEAIELNPGKQYRITEVPA